MMDTRQIIHIFGSIPVPPLKSITLYGVFEAWKYIVNMRFNQKGQDKDLATLNLLLPACQINFLLVSHEKGDTDLVLTCYVLIENKIVESCHSWFL